MERPEIHRYHDYREFLKDWLAYRKASQSGFSLRLLAKAAGLASGYLPMILSGKRPLSAKALGKLAPELGLSRSERAYLEQLVVLGDSDSQAQRLEALERMRRFEGFRRANPRETEVYRYLTRWYYVVIREMAALPGFQLDASWIAARLREPVPLAEVEAAVAFLVDNGYVERVADGGARLPKEKDISCVGGVYRVALTQFHQEMLAMASKSIETVPSEARNILGHTFALDERQLDQAKEIMNRALEEIRALGRKEKAGTAVYHAELALFPVTHPAGVKQKEGK